MTTPPLETANRDGRLMLAETGVGIHIPSRSRSRSRSVGRSSSTSQAKMEAERTVLTSRPPLYIILISSGSASLIPACKDILDHYSAPAN